MPSAKILSEKQAYVADLKAKFESAVSGCVVAYGGINVENDTKLRKELREAGVDYMVVKNTMLRLAVKGTSLEGLAEQVALLLDAGQPLLKEIEGMGVTVTRLSADERAAFVKATKPVYDKWKGQIGTDLVTMAEKAIAARKQ